MSWMYITSQHQLRDDKGNLVSSFVYPGELIDVEEVPKNMIDSMYSEFKSLLTGYNDKLYKIKSLKSANISQRGDYSVKPNVAGRFIIISYLDGKPVNGVREATSSEISSYQVKTVTTPQGNKVTLDYETTSTSVANNLPRKQLMEQSESGDYVRLTETVGEVDTSGLRIQNLRGVLGIPHQFLPTTDPRVTVGGLAYNGLGRLYTKFIIKHMPLLIITPGVPKFMGSAGSTEKKNVLQALMGATIDNVFNLGSGAPPQGSYSGKYYTLDFKYTEYFKYVNTMLRAASVFIGVADVNYFGRKLGDQNWMFDKDQGRAEDVGWLAAFVGEHFGRTAVFLYANVGESTSDSFTNTTTQSQLANTLNSYSDKFREMNFLLGTGMAMYGSDAQDSTSTVSNGDASGDILNKAKTILSGGRLEFPEIWSDSQFGRSYNVTMKLISPYGDKLSVFLNILVPIYHILALALPRHDTSGIQGYVSPFLIRAYYKGIFNVDLGIISSLSITKGAEGEWTRDGVPTVAEISFEIKDLYDGFFMSQGSLIAGYGGPSIFTNITELDYIANSCGINVNAMEVDRMIKYYWKILKGSWEDLIQLDLWGSIGQWIMNAPWRTIFSRF